MASIVSCTASRVAAAAGGGLAEPKGSKGPLPVVSLRVSPSSALAHAEPEKPAETDHALAVAGPRINTLSLRLRPGLQGFSAGSKASGVVFGDQVRVSALYLAADVPPWGPGARAAGCCTSRSLFPNPRTPRCPVSIRCLKGGRSPPA